MARVVDQQVLVLNRNWQPVTFLRVGVAIATCVRDMAWILHPVTFELLEWDRWCEEAPAESRQVPTPSGPIPAPDAVVLRAYDRIPQRGCRSAATTCRGATATGASTAARASAPPRSRSTTSCPARGVDRPRGRTA